MSINNKNILITGAGGFVGRNLLGYLNGKYRVFPTTHKDLELTDEAAVKSFIDRNNINIIIHCANTGGSRTTGYDSGAIDVVKSNLKMFYNLVKTLGDDRLMIHFGSGAEFGREHWLPKMKEEYFGTHIPSDDYGFSKYVCASYINDCCFDNMVNLRIFGLFGKYENYQFKFISNAIVKNLIGLPITINQNVYFDYLYISDFVQCVEYFINNKPKHKSYNIVKGETIDLISIANIINKCGEKPSEIIVKNNGLNAEYSGDNTWLLAELNGFKYMSYEDSIRDLYSWYKANISIIDKETVMKDEYIKYCKTK